MNSSGDTLVAVVAASSGRPDSIAVPNLARRTRTLATVLVISVYGAIPVTLAVITMYWLIARRRRDQLSMSPV